LSRRRNTGAGDGVREVAPPGRGRRGGRRRPRQRERE
jgi:hypothetical protein